MSLIVSPIEFTREWMDRATDAGAEQFIDAVRPIYGSDRSGRAEHIGSCLLIEWQGRYYLVTAAHIVDLAEKTKLYVGVAGELMSIAVSFMITEKPEKGRDHDHYDFAWLELSDDNLPGYRSFNYITPEMIVPRTYPQQRNLHLALGYPNSRNKTKAAGRPVEPHYLKYSATLTAAPDLCKEYSISSRTHLFLNHNNKRSKDSAGKIVNSYCPIGASGGALVNLGTMGIDGRVPPGKLAGLLIENINRHKVIVAVRIHVILDQMTKVAGGKV